MNIILVDAINTSSLALAPVGVDRQTLPSDVQSPVQRGREPRFLMVLRRILDSRCVLGSHYDIVARGALLIT